ncbi:MAG: hypothetical protein SGBAC_012975 [Bacillariaceae sp.]
MSSFQQSNDDFFNSPLTTPPKQSSRLTQPRAVKPASATNSKKPKPSTTNTKTNTTTNTTRLAKRTATTTRRAPPPPRPNKAGVSAGAASSSSLPSSAAAVATAASTKARPARRRPNRLPAPSAQTLQSSGSVNAGAASAASTSSNSFYSNGTAGRASTASSTSNTGMGGTGFYNSPATAGATTTATATTQGVDNQWDSWASPAPAASATMSQQQQQQQQPWQAPAPSGSQPLQTNAASSSNDWYSGGTMDPTPAPAMAATVPTSFDQWQHQQPILQGSMDNASTASTSAAGMATQPVVVPQQASMFQPSAFFSSTTSADTAMAPNDEDDFENEAPLLEELGVHFDHILLKTKTVCWPFTRTADLRVNTDMVDAVVSDADLIGPICYCLALGGEMVLAGKLQFGYIYGFGLFGCVAMTLIVNLTSPKDAVSFWVVSSVLGYALIPVNILALVKIIIINLASLQKLGRILGLITVLWSTTASTRLLEIGCGLREQRYLIAYPIALLYSAFVLITIF